jgi:hypothetical protein
VRTTTNLAAPTFEHGILGCNSTIRLEPRGQQARNNMSIVDVKRFYQQINTSGRDERAGPWTVCCSSAPQQAAHDDFDVLADGAVVGRILKIHAAPVGSPWMWTLAFGHHEDRTPTHGYAETREAAMAAFAKSWRRE